MSAYLGLLTAAALRPPATQTWHRAEPVRGHKHALRLRHPKLCGWRRRQGRQVRSLDGRPWLNTCRACTAPHSYARSPTLRTAARSTVPDFNCGHALNSYSDPILGFDTSSVLNFVTDQALDFTSVPLLRLFSAEVLMLSPAAEGLFHRVILESGSAKGTWLDLNGPEFAKIVASANGASDIENITKLEEFYLSLSYPELLALSQVPDYFSDGLFIYGIVESARLHALNSAPVYLYEFTYEASIYQTTGPSGLGSTHCTQTNLILNEGPLSPLGHLSENDLIVQRRLVDMWTNFIKNGEPIIPPEDADYWEPLNPEKMNYLEINLNIQQQNFPVSERMEIWDQIMKENNDRDSASEVKYSLSLFLLTLSLIIQ
ncbi:Carboxylesterase 5A [Eumeta japonica]|uniref:Carboxylesterase 5A n=1 Tax=Eumeta variegata TaxID=151549 RepID=A0A4C1V8W3_EUMVA|nr:Carboxylesterase 5A [Eumeta japonica]